MLQEAPISIAVNGERRVVLSCSPHRLEALAAGYLLAEGWIRNAGDIRFMTVDGPTVSVDLDVARVEAVLDLRHHQTRAGCGLRHFLDCEGAALPRIHAAVPALHAAPLFRALFDAADAASPEGGVHAAAISDGATLLHISTDVARHCAVDRAIGQCVLAGDERDGRGLLLTARVSGAIALKAVHARLHWIASRSLATSLAHEIAEAAGVHIIERAARRAS